MDRAPDHNEFALALYGSDRAGEPSPDTRTVLVNTVCSKRKWALQFRKDATRAQPFYLDRGDRVRVPLMHPVFRADHPFLFAIRDRTSGALPCLGRVADPTRPR